MVAIANTRHVRERIAERVTDPEERDRLFRAMLRHAASLSAQGVHSVAVRFARVAFHGDRWDGTAQHTTSNGDCAVFVMRDDTIVTFMWRRAEQPHHPAQYRVNATRCVKSACTGTNRSHQHV